MFEQKDMTGSLFKNDEHAEGNNRPNAKGKCKIAGIEYYVSAWARESANGTKYQSLAFTPVAKSDPDDHRVSEGGQDDAPFPF